MYRNSRPNSGAGRRNRVYYARMRRRRRRQRLGAFCCLAVFLLGFLSGKAVTLRIMQHEVRNVEVQAAEDFTVALEPVGEGRQVDRHIASGLPEMPEDEKN